MDGWLDGSVVVDLVRSGGEVLGPVSFLDNSLSGFRWLGHSLIGAFNQLDVLSDLVDGWFDHGVVVDLLGGSVVGLDRGLSLGLGRLNDWFQSDGLAGESVDVDLLVLGVDGRSDVGLSDDFLSGDGDVDGLFDGSGGDLGGLVDFGFDQLFSHDLSLDQRSLDDLSLDHGSLDDSLGDEWSGVSFFGDDWFAPLGGGHNRFGHVRSLVSR